MQIRTRFISFAAAVMAASSLPADVIPPATVKQDVFGSIITDARQVDDAMEGPQFELQFTGLPELGYDILSSIDFLNWTNRGSEIATGGSGLYQEALPTESYRVYQVAFNGSGDSTPPTWPVGAALLADNVESGAVDLDWPAASDDTGIVAYALYRDGVHVATVNPAGIGAFIDGLTPNTVYTFDLVACDAGGNCTQLPGGLDIRTRTPQEPYLDSPRHGAAFLSSGEFSISRTDIAIPARELGFVFTRTYRSDFEKSGPLGYGWTANVFDRLRERNNGDVVWLQGIGRSDTFVRQPSGEYLAPPGVFMTLTKSGPGFQLIDAAGTTRHFGPAGRIQAIATRNGNTLTYQRTGTQLTSITDDMGRTTTFAYTVDDRIETLTDFTGREVRYTYDAQGNLLAARSPIVSGTPNGNNFPAGKTERYLYDTANPDPDLAHNLVAVIAPNEVEDASLTPSLVLTYGSGGPFHDRLLTETAGGTNASGVPAGGTTIYTYATLANGNIAQTTVTDPRGNDVEYFFGPTGHLNVKIEFLAGRPNPTSTYNYDPEGNLLTVTHPEGNGTTHVYDSANASRRSQGNRLSTTHTPGPRGADQPQLLTTTTYEPVFNLVLSTTDPRSNTWSNRLDYEEACDFAAIGAKIGLSAPDAQALVQAAGLCTGGPAGDLNNDGLTTQVNGNVLERHHPTVALDPASHQALLTGTSTQDVVEVFQYNPFGQLITHRDAELNVHQRTYHPETDPDGDGTIDNPAGDPTTGGYLASTVQDALAGPNRNSGTDPSPTAITTTYAYNPRGALTSVFDPRGVETRQVLNALDQPVQVLRAASTGNSVSDPPEVFVPLFPFAYISDFFYDANNNLVRHDVEDRGDFSNTGGMISTGYEYDILNRLLATTEEINISTSRTTANRYDPNGNLALTVFPEGNAVSHEYEERNLRIATTTGAQSAPPEAQIAAASTYNPRGGLPSTVTFHYDDNGNRDSITDAEDTDGSPANNGTAGGDRGRIAYDGYDRPVASIDPVGNGIRTTYDANANVVRTERFGPDGGTTPLTDTPSNNLLEDTQFHYDVLNRLVQTDRALFSNTLPGNGSSEGATSIGKGDLVPGDGAVNARFEYDALGRRTFTVQDDEDVSSTLYDGAGRALSKTDPAGNQVEYAYDDNHNVIEIRETDVSTKAGIADEIFLTTRLYDSLNRPWQVTDNLGQTTRFSYDSRDNISWTTDANGPLIGGIVTRRAFPSGPLTVNAINTLGNVIRYAYDGLDRLRFTVRPLTTNGVGTGSIVPPTDPTQGGGDGHITTAIAYDLNSLVESRDDDNGYRTEYEYDNLNRVVAEHRGVVSGSPGLTTTLAFQYDPDHNLVQRTDEIGTLLNHTYDAINRRTAVSVVPGPGVVGTTAQTFEYDGLSRLTFASDDNGNAAVAQAEAAFIYDSLSRVLVEFLWPYPSSPLTMVFSGWRAENLRAQLSYPNSRIIDFNYDALDRLHVVEESGSAPEIGIFEYIGTGRILELQVPAIATRHTYLNNAGTAVPGYDGARRPIGVRDLDGSNTVLTGFAHTFDRTANRLTEQKLHNPVNSETYAYDSAYRLLDLNRPAPASTPLQFSSWDMDGNNNWSSVDTLPRVHSNHNEIFSYDNPATIPVTSDDNGNVTDNGTGLTYQWDAFNRLVAVQQGGTQIARYFYDAAGRRVLKVNTNLGAALNGVTEYLYDGQQVIEERNGAGATLRQYVYGGGIDQPLRYDDIANGRAYHYHRNTLGSTFALTDIATSNVVERMLYDAYGAVQVTQLGGAPATGNPFLFTGRRLDPATGHYYYRARYLDTLFGRFLGRDPLGIWGDPASLGNAYAYCGNNPINCVDPSGMLEIHLTATYSSFSSQAGGSPNVLMDPSPPTAGVAGTAGGTPDGLMDRNPPNSLVINLSVAFQAAALEDARCRGALPLFASGVVTDNKHPEGHYRSMDWSSPLLGAVSIWDYERNFTEVSGLGAELNLAGNDNEWRFAGPSGTGKTFAPLQPAEFYSKGNKAAGFVNTGGGWDPTSFNQ